MLPTPPRGLNALSIVFLAMCLLDGLVFAASHWVQGWLQTSLLLVAVLVLIGLLFAFFLVLWKRPLNFYGPSDYPEHLSPRDLGAALNAQGASDADSGPTAPPLSAAVSESELLGGPDSESSLMSGSGAADFSGALSAMIEAKGSEDRKSAFDEALRLAADSQQTARASAIYNVLEFQHGNAGAMNELEKQASQDSTRSLALGYIGLAYSLASDYERASATYLRAAEAEDDPTKAAESTSMAFYAKYRHTHDVSAAYELAQLARSAGSQARAILLKGVADIANLADDHELRAAALTQYLVETPNDSSALFDAAWEYAKLSNQVMAAMLYKRALRLEPDDAMARNNLGFAYSELGLKFSANENFRAAAGADLGLAAGNLAYAMIQAGLGDEAKAVLDAAPADQQTEARVLHARSALADALATETTRRAELAAEADAQLDFTRKFAAAMLVPLHTAPLAGTWSGSPFGNLTFSNAGDEATALSEIADSGRIQLKGHWRGTTGSFEIRDGTHYAYLDQWTYSPTERTVRLFRNDDGLGISGLYLPKPGALAQPFTLTPVEP